jgi:holliday junction DNA helicase RuvA
LIGRLRGTLLEISGGLVTIDVGGVGYEVSAPDSLILSLPAIGEPLEVFIRQVFREDGTSLYAFRDSAERALFDLLTEVKGCGPKIGLSLLGTLGEETILQAILNQEARTLARASGVGPRLAERILLELKDKVKQEALIRRASSSTRPAVQSSADEVAEALVALGFRKSEIDSVLGDLEGDSTEERVRSALKRLRK